MCCPGRRESGAEDARLFRFSILPGEQINVSEILKPGRHRERKPQAMVRLIGEAAEREAIDQLGGIEAASSACEVLYVQARCKYILSCFLLLDADM